MHPFATYVIRSYYRATGWNEDNLYANLTRSSNAILDFTVPRGLNFSISKSPNSLFKTSYAMTALPSLHGSVGYIFTSCPLDIKGSGNVRVKDMVERFTVYDQPRRPERQEEEWLAGERVDKRDYLLYGRIHVPSGRLDAVYVTRLAHTLQGTIAAISDPRYSVYSNERARSGVSPSNMMFSLQHDTGRTCTEYTYSAEDGMWGVRFLHNFGKIGTTPAEAPLDESPKNSSKPKRVDEEDAMEGGLKGRISAGAEFYLSRQEKSAGVTAGVRFTTLPDATPPSYQVPASSDDFDSHREPPSQPPTTITALFNPIIGHITGSYAARVSRDLSMCSRFDFNVYSYESEWTIGAEWWTRRRAKAVVPDAATLPDPTAPTLPAAIALPPPDRPPSLEDINGVVKAKVSTSTEVSLMWEGRVRNLLVSLGIMSNLARTAKPINAIGLELSYFSSE